MNKEKFFQLNIGNLITILVLICNIVYFAGVTRTQMDNLNKRLEIVENTQKSLQTLFRADIDEVKKQLSKIDSSDTSKGQSNQSLFDIRFTNLDTRVLATEKYIPKIVEISTTLDLIKNHLFSLAPTKQN